MTHSRALFAAIFIARNIHSTLLAAVFVGVAGALGGCALTDKPVRPAVFDFGPGELKPASMAPQATTLAPLALAEVEANPALDSTAVVYRLAYDNVQQLRPYAQARWSMPPAQLVRQRLRTHLGLQRALLNPGEGVVASSTTAAPADAGVRLLRVELEEFSQVFESATHSVGLVRLRATLVQPTAAGEKLLAQREFTLQRPAPSLDAAGGVRALTLATEAAVQELDEWLRQLP